MQQFVMSETRWFLLLGSNKRAYKGADIAAVKLSSEKSIYEFKEAVAAVHAKRLSPSEIPDMQVYQHQPFDNESPVDTIASINTLGTNPKIPLIVVVSGPNPPGN